MNKGCHSGPLTLLTTGATGHFLSAYQKSASGEKHRPTSNSCEPQIHLVPAQYEARDAHRCVEQGLLLGSRRSRGNRAADTCSMSCPPGATGCHWVPSGATRCHSVPCVVMEWQAAVGQQMTCSLARALGREAKAQTINSRSLPKTELSSSERRFFDNGS